MSDFPCHPIAFCPTSVRLFFPCRPPAFSHVCLTFFFPACCFLSCLSDFSFGHPVAFCHDCHFSRPFAFCRVCLTFCVLLLSVMFIGLFFSYHPSDSCPVFLLLSSLCFLSRLTSLLFHLPFAPSCHSCLLLPPRFAVRSFTSSDVTLSLSVMSGVFLCLASRPFAFRNFFFFFPCRPFAFCYVFLFLEESCLKCVLTCDSVGSDVTMCGLTGH